MYAMKYYTAIENNEILPSGTTWVDLEGNEAEKANTNWFSLYLESETTKQKYTHKQRQDSGGCYKGRK